MRLVPRIIYRNDKIKRMHYQPNPDLYNRIMDKIAKEKAMASLRKSLFLSAFFSLFSAIGLIFGTNLFLRESKNSGLFDFISLGFSDIRVFSRNFNEFMLSILQALPIDTFAAILFILAAAIASFRALYKSIRNFNFLKNYN